MCSRSSKKSGSRPEAGGENSASQPTCICAVGVSTARNDASSPDRRELVIRSGQALAAPARATARAAPRYLSPAPLGSERELDERVEVVAQRRGLDAGPVQRRTTAAVVVVNAR